MKVFSLSSVASLLLLSVSARAQDAVSLPPIDLRIGDALQNVQVDSSIHVTLSGWMRVDYGFGTRFGAAAGHDELGISKMALKTDAQYEDFNFIAVLGSTILSDVVQADTTDLGPNDTTFKDLFVVCHDVCGTDATLIVGAQPILFGLKPNGYPGDRSLQPSIEFGGAGGFAVSNQAGPSVRAIYPIPHVGQVEAGVFDSGVTGTGSGLSSDGSRVYRNFFGQVRFQEFGVKGLSALVGLEGVYDGGTSPGNTDNTVVPVFDVGVAYAADRFDASLEYIALDNDLTNTANDETYWIAELTGFVGGNCRVMTDFATADELNAATVRVGTQLGLNDHVDVNFEFAHDRFGGGPDAESGQVRLTFHY